MIRNQFVGVGRFVNDLEIKEYDNFKVLEFSIAIDNSYQKDGEWVNNSHFFNCKCFDKVAEESTEIAKEADKNLLDNTINLVNQSTDIISKFGIQGFDNILNFIKDVSQNYKEISEILTSKIQDIFVEFTPYFVAKARNEILFSFTLLIYSISSLSNT